MASRLNLRQLKRKIDVDRTSFQEREILLIGAWNCAYLRAACLRSL
jgi:hypothetical protein